LQLNEREPGLSTSDRFVPLLRSIDFILAEQRELAAGGPHLTIWHRFQESKTLGCRPGEEILLISLNVAGRYVPLKVSLALKIVIDYLAIHRHIAQSASQIEAGIRSDRFYANHGSNVKTVSTQTRKICRSAIKVYVQRFRRALTIAALDAGLILDPHSVLISEKTEGNEVLYRLEARVNWRHIPLQ